MIPTLISAACMILLGFAGFLGWDSLNTEGDQVEMLMPVFFGGALLICIAFGRQHYRHGLYGGVIVALLGIISALIRIYQYEQFETLTDPRSHLIAVMGIICTIQLTIFWRAVKADRDTSSPPA